jgi:hypothetical protein
MQTRTLLAAGATAALALSVAAQQDGAADPWQAHRATKVLYAGAAGGTREKAFDAFLRQHFDHVGVIALDKLSMATAEGYDVVVVDWMSQYGNDGYQKRDNSLYSAPVKLGPEFTKPLIAMSYVGTQVRPDYKLDWL